MKELLLGDDVIDTMLLGGTNWREGNSRWSEEGSFFVVSISSILKVHSNFASLYFEEREIYIRCLPYESVSTLINQIAFKTHERTVSLTDSQSMVLAMQFLSQC